MFDKTKTWVICPHCNKEVPLLLKTEIEIGLDKEKTRG
jgi:hypothetical protein